MLTDTGWDKLVVTAPGHVGAVRRLVFDDLSAEQVRSLTEVGRALIVRIDSAQR